MWLNSRDAEDPAAPPRPPPPGSALGGSVGSASVWAYGSAPGSASASASAASSSSSLGAIGGANWRSRLLWNRAEPEEEEREEEALPSYLSYLQHPLGGLAQIHSSSGGGSSQADAQSYRAPPQPAFAAPRAARIEEKSKELALALQDFILTQVQPGGSTSGAAAATVCACGCDSLRERVAELTHQVHALQGQVTALLKASGPSLSSAASPFVPPGTAGPSGGSPGGGLMAPLPPPLPPPPPSPHHHHHLQVGMHHQLPMPMAPPPSPVNSAGSSSNSSALIDRVSTLEGRQSAFQSQLAQIAKVLGVPAGKQSKNAQLKTLVQTLREEIDAKLDAVSGEMQASLAANVREQTKQDALDAVDARMQALSADTAPSSPSSSLSYDAVLSALASEHEASMTRLSAAIEELVGEESKQRTRLQQRIDAHEEWLQQLEGALDSRFEPAAPIGAPGWAAAIDRVNSKLQALETSCEESKEQWRRLLADLPSSLRVGGAT